MEVFKNRDIVPPNYPKLDHLVLKPKPMVLGSHMDIWYINDSEWKWDIQNPAESWYFNNLNWGDPCDALLQLCCLLPEQHVTQIQGVERWLEVPAAKKNHWMSPRWHQHKTVISPGSSSHLKCYPRCRLFWLLVAANPSEKSWSSSVGMMKFPIYGKNVPNHQPVLISGNGIPSVHFTVPVLISSHITLRCTSQSRSG